MSRKDLELTDNEKELLEAMKAEPAEEPEPEEPDESGTEPEETSTEDKPRDEKGRFVKAKEDETEAEGGDEEPAPVEQPEKRERKVPLAVAQDERERRRGAENELAQLREEMRQLRESVTRPQPPAEAQQPVKPVEMPDPVMQPDKFNAWLADRLETTSKPIQDMTAQQKQAAEQARHIQTLKGFADQHEAHFRQTYADRDYDGALSFARQKVTENLRMLGYPDHAVPMMVAQQEMQLVATAAQNGISPAAYVYNYAVNMGFDDNKTVKASESGKVTRLAGIQKQTQSSAGASGGPKDEEWTFERVARIAEKGTEKEAMSIPPAVLKKFMGG